MAPKKTPKSPKPMSKKQLEQIPYVVKSEDIHYDDPADAYDLNSPFGTATNLNDLSKAVMSPKAKNLGASARPAGTEFPKYRVRKMLRDAAYTAERLAPAEGIKDRRTGEQLLYKNVHRGFQGESIETLDWGNLGTHWSGIKSGYPQQIAGGKGGEDDYVPKAGVERGTVLSARVPWDSIIHPGTQEHDEMMARRAETNQPPIFERENIENEYTLRPGEVVPVTHATEYTNRNEVSKDGSKVIRTTTKAEMPFERPLHGRVGVSDSRYMERRKPVMQRTPPNFTYAERSRVLSQRQNAQEVLSTRELGD